MLLTKLDVKSHVKLDFFHLEEADPSNKDIFLDAKYKPVLDSYSRFLVTFDDATTVSRGVADIALGYTFSIYKEIKGTNKLSYIENLGEGNLSIKDYNVANEVTYQYYIFKEDDQSISEAAISNEVTPCWWDWSLTDLYPDPEIDDFYYADSNNIWKFSLNVSSSPVTQKINNIVYDNLTRYPKVSMGKSNYSSGAITCLLGDLHPDNNNSIHYVEPADMLNKWNEFCTNGNIKLMKDRKGNTMLVTITGLSSQLDDVLVEQTNTITFNWTQIGDTNDVTIVGA